MKEGYHYLLSVDGEPWIESAIVAMSAREGLSEIPTCTVRLKLHEPADPERLIGVRACLEVHHANEEIRYVHGIIVEMGEKDLGDTGIELRLVIASPLQLLKLGQDCRIFQEKSTPEIVREVIEGAGLAELLEEALNETYEPRRYVVQYNESDWAFIDRLLAEEGIGYVIESRADQEKLILFDDATAFTAIEGDEPFTDTSVALAGLHTLHHKEERYRVATDAVALRDYDLMRPSADLTRSSEAEGATGRERYMHPGGYVLEERGQRLADRRMEALRAETRVLRGRSAAPDLMPGKTFDLITHARADCCTEWLIVRVEHDYLKPATEESSAGPSAESSYQNRFEAIPLERPWRPPFERPRPILGGVQLALASVPGGEEIHSEPFGRAKARFLWDRSGVTDDKSSGWMRVGQLALGGSMILPRVDFEVVIDHELGDLDRPAISGHLYNAELPPPYALPGAATRSAIQTATTEGGGGANELRFEDAAGGEEIFINASRDLIAAVDHNTRWNIGNTETVEIGGDRSFAVTGQCSATVAGSRSLTVAAAQSWNVGGDLGASVGADRSESVGGARMITVGGDHTEEVGGNLSRTVGALKSVTALAGYSRAVVGDSSWTIGAAWAEIAGRSRALEVGGSYTETVGALKLIKAKGLAVNVGAAYTMNAAAELVKAGGGRTDEAKGACALTAGAAFKVKAQSIVFEAKSKLVFRGGAASIELTKAGMVTIKAPKLTIKNSKALNQIMHKSN